MIIKRKASLLKLNPVKVFRSYPMFFHGYTIIHRANKLAKVASNTFFFFDGICVIRFAISQVDRLM
jgi:hypothetical protein